MASNTPGGGPGPNKKRNGRRGDINVFMLLSRLAQIKDELREPGQAKAFRRCLHRWFVKLEGTESPNGNIPASPGNVAELFRVIDCRPECTKMFSKGELDSIEEKRRQMDLPCTPGTSCKFRKLLSPSETCAALVKGETADRLEDLLTPRHPQFEGRTGEIDLLNKCLQSRKRAIVVFHAAGGFGKSSILYQWRKKHLLYVDGKRFNQPGFPHIPIWFEYTFANARDQQLTGPQEPATIPANGAGNHGPKHQSASGDFLNKFEHCLLRAGSPLDPITRARINRTIGTEELGRALARKFLEIGGVLVLDGLEALQSPTASARVWDEGVRAVIAAFFAVRPTNDDVPRMLVISTRWPFQLDKSQDELLQTHVRKVGRLDVVDGVKFLREFYVEDPDDPANRRLILCDLPEGTARDEEFRNAVDDVDGHPLSLLLIAMLLAETRTDLRQRFRPNRTMGTVDKGREILREVMQECDRILLDRDKHDVRKLLIELSLFEDGVALELLRDCFWDSRPQELDAAIRELSRLHMLNLFPNKLGVYPPHHLVCTYYRELEDFPVRRQRIEGFRRLFNYFRGARSDRLSAEVFDHDNHNAQISGQVFLGLLSTIKYACRGQCYRDAFNFYEANVAPDSLKATQWLPDAFSKLIAMLDEFVDLRKWRFRDDDPSYAPRSQGPAADGASQELDALQRMTLLLDAAVWYVSTEGLACDGARDCYKLAVAIASAAKPTVASRDVEPTGVPARNSYAGMVFASHQGDWRVRLVRGELASADEAMKELLAPSENRGLSPLTKYMAQGAAMCNYFYLGQLNKVEQLMVTLLELPSPDERRLLMYDLRMIFDPAVMVLIFDGWTKWLRGMYRGARRQIDKAIDLADETDSNITRIMAHYFAATFGQVLEDHTYLAANAKKVLEYATGMRNVFFEYGARFLLAWSEATKPGSKPDTKHLQSMSDEIDRWAGTAQLMVPWYSTTLAELYRAAGLLSKAKALLDKKEVSQSEEVWWRPEVLRVQSLLAPEDQSARRSNLWAAYRACAGELNSFALRLRVLTSLVREGDADAAAGLRKSIDQHRKQFPDELDLEPQPMELRNAVEALARFNSAARETEKKRASSPKKSNRRKR